MARKDDSNLLSRVKTALSRLDDRAAPKPPASLAPAIKEFRAGTGPLIAASEKSAAALGLRDEALEKVGEADAILDVSIDDLADACVGAKIGKRTRPFAGLPKHSPSALKSLG